MNSLPDDVIIYIALIMDTQEVLQLCNTHSKFNKIICNNQKYWLNKLLNDFPEDFKNGDIKKYGPDYKSFYKFHAYVTIGIEIIIDQYNEEAEKYEYIPVFGEFTYHKKKGDIKMVLANVIHEFISHPDLYGDLYGDYTITVDENPQCTEDYPYSTCFENVDVDTKTITVNYTSNGFISDIASLTPLLQEIIDRNLQILN